MKRISINAIGQKILFVLILLMLPLSQLNGVGWIMGYIDEVIILFLCLIIILALIRLPTLSKHDFILFILWMTFISIGVLSTIMNGEQSITAVLSDFIYTNKFFIPLLGFSIYLRRTNIENIRNVISSCVKFVSVVLFVLCIVHFLLNGLTGFYLLGSDPANLTFIGFALMIFVELCINKNKKQYLIISCFVCCSSLTSRGVGISFIFIWIVFFDRLLSARRLQKFFFYITGLFAMVLATLSDIQLYILNSNSSRATMLANGFNLAKEYFPLGSGFAMYGSASSVSEYSPLYTELGYLSRYGMGYKTTGRLLDMFWANIFGQFGYLGFVFFVILILMLFIKYFKLSQHHLVDKRCVILIFLFQIICSFGGAAFFSPYALLYAFILVYIEKNNQVDKVTGDCLKGERQ